jgi:predicted neuraminidase
MKLRVFILLFIGIAFASGFYRASHLAPAAPFQFSPIAITDQTAAHFETHFASSKLFIQVHAASAVELKDGRIRAYWFSGSREGAHDVQIHSAIFDPLLSRWSDEHVVVTREQTQQALHRYISKLGNPVVVRAADGSLRLFVVTVSLGGWAGSSLTSMISTDDGTTWSAPKRLITSPFLNISTLIKGTPFLYQDGTLGLPVYHEFISKFAEILRLDQQGNVFDKQRLAAGGQGTLQPVLLMQDEQRARVLMRYDGISQPYQAITVTTQDGGQHWSSPKKSTMRNSDSALTALTLADGRLLAVFNDLDRGREALSLMISSDVGETWQEVAKLEDQLAANQHADQKNYGENIAALMPQTDALMAEKLADAVESTQRTTCEKGQCRYEFSYPYMIQTQRADVHVVYTWNRTFIKHVSFNLAWLEQQLNHAHH